MAIEAAKQYASNIIGFGAGLAADVLRDMVRSAALKIEFISNSEVKKNS